MTSAPVSLPRLHLITDDDVLAGDRFLAVAREAMERGRDRLALHLRARRLSTRRMYDLGERVREIVEATGSLFVVNERVDVALALGAGAVQLPEDGLPVSTARGLMGREALIGRSVHSAAAAAAAAGQGADYLIAGTVFETRSHPDREGRGTEWLRELRANGVPVLGIGGISVERVPQVVEGGADGVAVLGGVWHSPDPGEAVERYLAVLEDR